MYEASQQTLDQELHTSYDGENTHYTDLFSIGDLGTTLFSDRDIPRPNENKITK